MIVLVNSSEHSLEFDFGRTQRTSGHFKFPYTKVMLVHDHCLHLHFFTLGICHLFLTFLRISEGSVREAGGKNVAEAEKMMG